MKISIVEQDELLSNLVSFRLELLGHQVTNWNCVAELLEKLGNGDVDLLIVDVYQPDMHGCEAIHKLRQSLSASEVPILALSIDTDLSLVEQAFKAGANDYLIMPFDPAILQNKTDKLLLQRQQHVTKRK